MQSQNNFFLMKQNSPINDYHWLLRIIEKFDHLAAIKKPNSLDCGVDFVIYHLKLKFKYLIDRNKFRNRHAEKF